MKNVNMILGRFQPITLGHLKIVDELYNKNNLPIVFCLVSNTKFDDKRPFDDNIISEELDIIMKEDKRIAGYVYVKSADIVKCAEILHNNMFEPHLWGCGTDRYESYKKQVDKYKDIANLIAEFDVLEIQRNDEDVSATKVRESIMNDDIQGYCQMMPKETHNMFKVLKGAIQKIKKE